MPFTTSDEQYILGLCDTILYLKSVRQCTFPFLLGDSGRLLPVDAYYPDRKLVIEYRERQHTEPVKLFDQRMTVSGVSRGEQRALYDQRRRDELPKHGIRLIELSYADFPHKPNKRLIRNERLDMDVLRRKLHDFISK